jgi:hypothetical protein
VLQSWMGRRVEGHATELCCITALVKAGLPRVLPGGVLAWHGGLAPRAS